MASGSTKRGFGGGPARRLPALAGATALLGALACGGALLPEQMQGGSSFFFALAAEGGAPIGFASELGGPDVQRGAVQFALCPRAQPLCEIGGGAGGFELQTQYVTRVAADPFSPAALADTLELPDPRSAVALPGAAVALLRVPRTAEGGPPPGRYRIEARSSAAGAPQDLLRGGGRTIEILPGDGEPLSLPVSTGLAQLVPLPRLTLSARRSAGARRNDPDERGPAAAELRIRFPAQSARIRGVAAVGRSDPQALLTWEPDRARDTVRVQLLAPRGNVRALGLAFEPLPGASPLRALDFEIVEQRVYDERGARRTDLAFAIEEELR